MNLSGKPALIVAGGGTGGHVLAGVAIADAWRARFGADTPVTFVGARGGIEEKLVPRAGYPLELLTLGTLNRVSLGRKLKTFIQLPLALLRSLAILIQARPAAVIGVGGYASGPLVLMARLLSRTAILEQNSVPGFTNRVLGRLVHRVFCAFPGTEGEFGSAKALLTGNPIRVSMKKMAPAARDPFTVFAFGGSQGAIGVNSLLLDALAHLGDLKSKLRFIHQTGEKDHERVRQGYASAGFQARVEKFIYEMPEAYAAASLLVCRAGSSTLSEVAAVGRAAVLVPFPFASDNHQEKNARIFSDAGAAFLMIQGQAKGEDLARLIRGAVADPGILEKVEKEVTGFYRPDAAKDIVQALSGDLQ